MLVDIGGRPRDTQFRLFDACTHVIHLWREAEDRQEWETWLDQRSLIPIASLRTQLAPPDRLEPAASPLRGVITGLDRAAPQAGPVFERVLQHVLGICSYPPDALEAEHLRQAPEGIPQLTVTQLADEVGLLRPGQKLWWEPAHLALALDWLPPGQSLAFYGPGPLWLYAAIATRVAPAPFFVFDARFYGWMLPPPVILDSDQTNEEFMLKVEPMADQVWLRFNLRSEHHVLHPSPIHLPLLPDDRLLVLDGKMPIWFVSALARALCGRPAWPSTIHVSASPSSSGTSPDSRNKQPRRRGCAGSGCEAATSVTIWLDVCGDGIWLRLQRAGTDARFHFDDSPGTT